MPAKRDLDPGASPLHFFGAEVRRARETAGMTLADLGAVVPCDPSTVSKIEAGQLRPTERGFDLTGTDAGPARAVQVRQDGAADIAGQVGHAGGDVAGAGDQYLGGLQAIW